MAQRRSLFDAMPGMASPMTPQGGSQTTHEQTPENTFTESKDTFRRRTTPVVGQPEQGQSQLQEILAMMQGGSS